MKKTNFATKTELEKQIKNYEDVIPSMMGIEKTLFEKILIDLRNDLKTGNHQ